MDDLIETYYETSTTQRQNTYERGEIYWAPSLFLERDLRLVRPVDPDPWAGDIDGWEIRRATETDLDPPPFDHLPLISPRLQSHEEYLAIKAKKRPVILFSSGAEVWTYRSGRPREPVYVMLPMFSFYEDDPIEFRLGIQALDYRELFYLGADDSLDMVEGFVRFDRMHVVPRGWLKRRLVRLTDDAMLLLDEWFKFYITGIAPDWLLQYREERGRATDELLAGAG